MDGLTALVLACMVVLIANVTLQLQKLSGAQGAGLMSIAASKLGLPENIGMAADVAVSAVGVVALALAMRATENVLGLRVNANFTAVRS